MPHEKLTPSVVERLVRGATRREFVVDDANGVVRGFGLRVSGSGDGAFYIVRRELGRLKWTRIGPWQMSLDEARRSADAIGGDLARGRDVNAERRAERERRAAERSRAREQDAAPTVAELVRRYVETRTLADKTAKDYAHVIAYDLETSPLGKKKAALVVQADVRTFVKAVAKRGPHKADKALLLLRSAYKWGAHERGESGATLVMFDPCFGVERPTVEKDRERRRVLIKAKAPAGTPDAEVFAEVKQFWTGVERMRPVPRAYVRLLLLLGLRRGEAAAAQWGEIRLDGKAPSWHVPAERRKVRRTKLDPDKDSIDVPLSPLAVRLLREIRPASGEGRVFPHLHAGTVAESMLKWTGIEDLQLHDLRRTCTSAIRRMGAAPHIVTMVLGHRAKGLADSDVVYMQAHAIDEYARWLALWADKVEKVAGVRRVVRKKS
jgi:integrase